MSVLAPPPAFGSALRHWRGQRGLSQLALALQADVSARHLSWLETGKAEPSRAMVLRLAERLDLPLRERNALLAAAGFAPLYRERPLSDRALAPARAALQRLLDAQAPSPALAVDRRWDIVAHNRMLPPMLALVAPELRAAPVNALRVSLHPRGFAPMIGNLAAWREHSLARVRRQLHASGDPALAALLAELQAYPGAGTPDGGGDAGDGSGEHGGGDAIVPIVLNTPFGRLEFITTLTVFGAPHDVTLAELAIETLLPADRATAAALQRLDAAGAT